eukprot:gene12369-14317_t
MSSPLHKKYTPAEFDESERIGLTTDQAEELYKQWGYNELPEVTVSLWWVLFVQFTGTMPYMLELAAIIAIAVQDYTDFAIILAMLLANGFLGFHEQLKAAESLAELTNKMEQKIPVLRDGKAEQLLTRLLVPGDVVLLMGGVQVPADIEWMEGDVLSVDTAALTGEPLPRKYPSDEHGPVILCACTVRAGEAYGIVRKTGINTEIGSANADIMKDKTQQKMSVFETRVLLAVKIIICLSLADVLLIFLIQGFVRNEFNDIKELLLTCLSIIIAAIPVALPLVMQVTMALGAGKMARDFDSVVTSLPALQDISSMTILCSDKTGTLTTARITIHAESVWCCGNFTKQDVALYGVLASNPDKKEDPIDRSVTGHFERVFGPSGANILKEYTKTRSVGFNPIFKRVVYEYTHPKIGRITIAKGLPTKVLDTADGGKDDAADQWVVKDANKLKAVVEKTDYDFSKAGYKTLGVHCGSLFKGNYAIGTCNTQTQAIIWVQMFIAAELLIFTTRASSYIWCSQLPSPALIISVFIGCIVVSAMAAGSTQFGELHISDIVLVWVYDIAGLFFLDLLKVAMFNFFEENLEVLADVEISSKRDHGHGHGHGHDVESAGSAQVEPEEDLTRASLSANRLTDWAIQHSERLSSMDANQRLSMATGRSAAQRSQNMRNTEANKHARESMSGSVHVVRTISAAGGGELRPSFIGGSIRPNVPGNRSKF